MIIQNIDDSKSHNWNYFIKNIISGIQLFYINPQVPANIIKFFFVMSDFLEKVSKPAKSIHKSHLFCNTCLLKTPHSFYEPQLT